MTTKSANDYDKLIASAMRKVRVSRGYSQEFIGNALGITFQQVQKYERGTNRISMGKFILFCKVCDVSPCDFFKMLDTWTGGGADISEELKPAWNAMTDRRRAAAMRALFNLPDAAIDGFLSIAGAIPVGEHALDGVPGEGEV